MRLRRVSQRQGQSVPRGEVVQENAQLRGRARRLMNQWGLRLEMEVEENVAWMWEVEALAVQNMEVEELEIQQVEDSIVDTKQERS